jgi:hypothetical protein
MSSFKISLCVYHHQIITSSLELYNIVFSTHNLNPHAILQISSNTWEFSSVRLSTQVVTSTQRCFRQRLTWQYTEWGVVKPTPKPRASELSYASCPRRFIQYIRSCYPQLIAVQSVSKLRLQHGRCDKGHNMETSTKVREYRRDPVTLRYMEFILIYSYNNNANAYCYL